LTASTSQQPLQTSSHPRSAQYGRAREKQIPICSIRSCNGLCRLSRCIWHR
jgi:hypothetical protein